MNMTNYEALVMRDRAIVRDLHPSLAANFLHAFHSSEGYPGGGFFSALFAAMSRADDLNLMRLAKGFPEHVAAYRLATRDPDGVNLLREVANQ